MTGKELAELLGTYPEDLRVVVNGYEDGYDDLSPERISVIKIQLDAHPRLGEATQRFLRFGQRNK